MMETRDLLKDRAYRTLKQMLLDGVYLPGTFLSERQLVDALGMSKTPIRTALERLEHDGFVSISPQQGIVVRELSLKEIVDHYDIRSALESFVVSRLAGNLTTEQVARLRAMLDAQAAQVEAANSKRYIELDGEFHLALCHALDNREILRVMRHQRDKLHRVISHILESDPSRMRVSYQEHVALLEALLSGDGDLAAARMREHLNSGKRFLLSL